MSRDTDSKNTGVAVSLPRTSTRRGAHSSALIVRRVDLSPKTPEGLAWEGTLLKPGAVVSEKELLAHCHSEGCPVVLERTEILTRPSPVRKFWTLQLILWQFDKQTRSFAQIASVQPPNSYECQSMRELAAKALGQELWRKLEAVSDSAGRIEDYLAREIHLLGPRKAPVIERVIDGLVSRLIDETGFASWPPKKPVVSETVFESEEKKQVSKLLSPVRALAYLSVSSLHLSNKDNLAPEFRLSGTRVPKPNLEPEFQLSSPPKRKTEILGRTLDSDRGLTDKLYAAVNQKPDMVKLVVPPRTAPRENGGRPRSVPHLPGIKSCVCRECMIEKRARAKARKALAAEK